MIEASVTGQSLPSLPDKRFLLWGLVLLVILFVLGLTLFIVLRLLPLFQQHTVLNEQLASARSQLVATEQLQAELPARLQTRLNEGQAQLAAAASQFLSEAQATDTLDQIYTYSSATQVEIVELESQSKTITDTFSVDVFGLRAVGTLDHLFDFLAQMQGVTQPGFVMSGLTLAPDPIQPAEDESTPDQPESDLPEVSPPPTELRYSLSMQLAFYISPYASTRSPVQGEVESAARGQGVLAASLVDDNLRQNLQTAWQNNAWQEAIAIAQQILAAAPDRADAVETVYRAHLNYGYHLLVAHRVEEARLQFDQARNVKPDGQEAHIELAQLDITPMMLFAAEQQLIRELESASAANNWQEALRILRLLQALNPNFPGLVEQLNQTYVRFGDQLAADGRADLAQEQYQQAQQILTGY